jgi:hypothetical protein
MNSLGDLYERVTGADVSRIRAETEGKLAHKAEIEAEIQMIREKRSNVQMLTETPPPKRARTLPKLNADGPMTLGQRRSISHNILHKLYEEMGHEGTPPLERVFEVVYAWFVCRHGKAGKCTLDFRTIRIDDTAVVYVWQRGHKHAFFDTRYYEQLLAHVKTVLFRRWEDAHEENAPGSMEPTVNVRRIAPCFVKSERNPGPCELRPISMQQQQQDVECLCQSFGLCVTDWPAKPDETIATTAGYDRQFAVNWAHIPAQRTMKISEWLKQLRTPADPDVYVLVILMKRLHGWQSPIGSGYTKAAVPCIRRAIAATRGLTVWHPLYRRITAAVGGMRPH